MRHSISRKDYDFYALHRFFSKIEYDDRTGCWLWTGARDNWGYALMDYRGRGRHIYRAARFAYESHKGRIPAKLTVDHLCRNRLCVNPNHLEAITEKENILRGNGVCANNARKTHCIRGHLFSSDSTYHPQNKPNKRACRICQRERHRKWKLKMGGD